MSCSLCSENGGHFKPKYGGHFDRFFQLKQRIDKEIEKISQYLANRITELVNRYETPLPSIETEIQELQTKVNQHLQKMGMVWN